MKELRYGKVLILADQDLDGSHIKGLCVNMFHDQWPSLAKHPGFLSYMNTPILRAKKGKEERIFYNEGEYQAWRKESGEKEAAKWTIKYYKGLGTSTSKEFKQYFMDNKCVEFQHTEQSTDIIDKVFNKKRSDDRKKWLENYDGDDYVNTTIASMTYEEFVDREMIQFSRYDCSRSIPGADGFKTSLRKILYAMFKRNALTEVKVAQLGGFVAEHSGYHHGEVSLQGAIVGMAQTFVGSNNINLLKPNGQFGTRLEGGKDSASPRYIFTRLSTITRCIFHPDDDAILNYLQDDGDMVEPDYYLPIIPMLLVNGSIGIGTGFSTTVLCYNPEHIIDYTEALVRKSTTDLKSMPLDPYYEGFRGTIEPFYKGESVEYLIRGVYEVNGNTVKITELPVGTWTTPYKEFIEKLIEKGEYVRDYVDMSTDKTVELILTMMQNIEEKTHAVGTLTVTNLEKILKLYTTATTTNMHAFDHNNKLVRYKTAKEVAEAHYSVRLDGYVRRKAHLLNALQQQLLVLSNRTRFIVENLEQKIDLRRMTKVAVIALLEDREFDKVNGDYKYLTQMPMDSVTQEKVDQLLKERDAKDAERTLLEGTGVTDIWLADLHRLRMAYRGIARETLKPPAKPATKPATTKSTTSK
jgi:DNA topoisomerase II